MFEAFVDVSTDALVGVDGNGAVVSWNRSAERIFGRAAAEVLGRPISLLFPPELRPTIGWLLDIVASGDRIERYETEVERKGGMATPIALTLQPVVDGGEVVAVAALARDVTEQRLAQATLAETESRLRESEALAHVGRWMWDTGTGTVQWSDELHHIHGIDPWEFAGDIDAHLAAVAEADRVRVRTALDDAVATGRPFETEYDIVHPDGSVHRVYARAEPTMGSGGAVVGLRGIVHDTAAR